MENRSNWQEVVSCVCPSLRAHSLIHLAYCTGHGIRVPDRNYATVHRDERVGGCYGGRFPYDFLSFT